MVNDRLGLVIELADLGIVSKFDRYVIHIRASKSSRKPRGQRHSVATESSYAGCEEEPSAFETTSKCCSLFSAVEKVYIRPRHHTG